MSYYECKRCSFQSKQRTGMIRHLTRKNKCIKNILSYKYTDNQLYEMSLEIIKEPFDYKNIDETQNYCFHCKKIFSTRGNLKKHLNKNMISYNDNIPTEKWNNSEDKENFENIKLNNNFDNKNDNKNDNFNYQYINNDYINQTNEKLKNNTVNNITVNQQVNNYNFYGVKYPISFDNEWDLSKISDEKKLFLISCCDTKYSELLKYILQNDNNLNVIIENETNSGIVYKNDIEKFINMDKCDIIDQSLSKLNQQLNNLCKEIINKNEVVTIYDKINDEKEAINQKYDDYKNNNNNIKQDVQNVISTIFNEKKDETINRMNDIINSENKNNLIKNKGF